MKDKNTIIGWVLIGLVFIGYMIYSGKNQEKQAEYAQNSGKTGQHSVITHDQNLRRILYQKRIGNTRKAGAFPRPPG